MSPEHVCCPGLVDGNIVREWAAMEYINFESIGIGAFEE